MLATNIFFVFEKSIFSFINILIPLDAMNPYKTMDTPPMTQVGIVIVKDINGEKKAKIIEKRQDNRITFVEAIFVTPTTATFSPYVVLAAPQISPLKLVAIPSPINVLDKPGSVNKSLCKIPDIFLWSPMCSHIVTKLTGMNNKAAFPTSAPVKGTEDSFIVNKNEGKSKNDLNVTGLKFSTKGEKSTIWKYSFPQP